MRRLFIGIVAVFSAITLTYLNPAEAKALRIAAPPKPSMQAAQADVIVLGKIIEIEKDSVMATPYKGAKDQKVSYKIAVVKIEDPLIGARGLTQLRVGFFADAPAVGGPIPVDQPRVAIARPLPARVGFGPVALTKDMEGVFLLAPHHDGDFYILVNNSAPLLKKDEGYDKELETITKTAKAIDEPVKALSAKDKADRHQAAAAILIRYRGRPVMKVVEEDIPAEENKLLLAAITEMSWLPEGNDYTKPARNSLWHYLQADKFGFKQPMFKPPVPGAPPMDYSKMWEEATTAFLKENIDKIKIKRFKTGN